MKLDILNKTYPFDFGLKKRLIIATWVGVGIFLFILFFQPFKIEQTDFNNYLLLVAGFGGMTFIIQSLIYLIIPFGSITFSFDKYNLNILLVFELLAWILNSVAFSFYLRYVGHVPLSFFLVFRIVLLCLMPMVINMLIYETHDLKLKLSQSLQVNMDYSAYTDADEASQLIELASASRSEKLKLKLNELILVKAAENYVEVYYRKDESLQKKLIRTTLSSIEDQLNVYPVIIRCHRNCIINISHVEKMKRTPEGFRIIVTGYKEEVSVSRQYLLQVRNALKGS